VTDVLSETSFCRIYNAPEQCLSAVQFPIADVRQSAMRGGGKFHTAVQIKARRKIYDCSLLTGVRDWGGKRDLGIS